MVKDYYDVRAVFKKTGRAIFISHLDLMRLMQRTFKRARLPVWFTKGYNPHIYLTFPLPLSLGVSSECEFMDFGMDMAAGEPDFEDIKSKMNAALPTGIEIVRLYQPVHSHTEIGSCEYTADFYKDMPSSELLKLFDKFMSSEKIIIKKRCKVNMKKTIVDVDIKPDITVLDKSSEDGKLHLGLRLPAGIRHSLNIVSMASAFEGWCGFEFDKICLTRTKILLESGENFI